MEQPVYRPRNYVYEGIVLLIQFAMMALGAVLLQSFWIGCFAGWVCYIVIAWTLRLSFQKHHRRGMMLLRMENYAEAAAAFRKSEAFFRTHPIIDRYPFITMLSSNAIPYRQMALNNLGICCIRLDQPEQALEAFETLRELNPDYPNVQKESEMLRRYLEEAADCTDNASVCNGKTS